MRLRLRPRPRRTGSAECSPASSRRSASAAHRRARGRGRRVRTAHRGRFGGRARRLELGASISVDGVCLTVAGHGAGSFFADVSGKRSRVQHRRQERCARESGAGAARRRQPRRTLGLGPRRWHRAGSRRYATRARCASSSWRPPRCALLRAQGLGRTRRRESHGQRSAARRSAINLDSAHARGDHARQIKPGARVNLEIDLLARYLERLSSMPA